MKPILEDKNSAIMLEAFDTLFNRRDYAAAEKFWSPHYIQHSAHIPPDRDGLFNRINPCPLSLRYEHGLIMAEGDFVIVHRRHSNTGLPVNWIVTDILGIKDGILAEHWDVIQKRGFEGEVKKRTPDVRKRFPN